MRMFSVFSLSWFKQFVCSYECVYLSYLISVLFILFSIILKSVLL